MNKKINKTFNHGVTLVELVVTIAIASILTTGLVSFVYFFVNASRNLDTFSRTIENANYVAYYIRDFIDQNNDQNLNVPSDSSVLLSYGEDNNTINLIYDENTDELKYGDTILYTSKDNTLTVNKTFYEETNIIKFNISYNDNKGSISFVKNIYKSGDII